MSTDNLWRRLRRTWARVLQNYRHGHVPERCLTSGCDCPCGYCRHDQRHIPGEVARDV